VSTKITPPKEKVSFYVRSSHFI